MSERYRVQLGPTWIDYFDRQIWRFDGDGEFDHPVDPETLLDERPEFIWPGFMLPDSLPVMGNRYGDWLCMRIGPDDRVSEVIYWYHGGGDWIPWGGSLAEAITFDTLRPSLPGRRIRYAQQPADADAARQPPRSRLRQWAATHLPSPLPQEVLEIAPQSRRTSESLERLLQSGFAPEALRCELVLGALDSNLRVQLTPAAARKLGVPWEPEVVQWMFDTQQIPASVRQRLPSVLDATALDATALDATALDTQQDWGEAERLARQVVDRRSDLGWAWDVLGWACERRGDLAEAIRCYAAGLRTSAFADQTIRFRTHWHPEAFGKFAAFRLWELRDALPGALARDPYLNLFWQGSSQGLRRRVSEYWRDSADAAEAAGQWGNAYLAWTMAGWDLGLEEFSEHVPLLDRLAEAAERAGWAARAEVARTHLACLKNRIG